MKVVSKKVNTYQERLFCDCGREMEYVATFGRGWSKEHTYKCLECGKFENSEQLYPKITYKEVESGEDS